MVEHAKELDKLITGGLTQRIGSAVDTSSITESISASDITKFNKTSESFIGITPKVQDEKIRVMPYMGKGDVNASNTIFKIIEEKETMVQEK